MAPEEDEPMCRFCFEGKDAGELISPCKCTGGQRYVHLSCLRRWQRMVLVSQPTHPAFYDRDVRHHKCNVCLEVFNIDPPTRHDLMESFTGPELAGLIDEGCVIAADEAVSAEMERERDELPEFARASSGYDHWIRGVYLITECRTNDARIGDDLITAVNIGHQRKRPMQPDLVDEALALLPGGGAEEVRFEHYTGGPCMLGMVTWCVVPGGSDLGWTVVQDLDEAVRLAHDRATKRTEAQGGFSSGQAVRVEGHQERPDLNGEVGTTLEFDDRSCVWPVRLRNGEIQQLKPANLTSVEPAGLVLVFWGHAQWSRTQLLGEIARGHWGLCRASVSDLHAKAEERFRGLDGRLAFAPVTEMTEACLRDGQREMQEVRASRERLRAAPPPGGTFVSL